jgi:adenylate cyclase
VWSDLLEFKPSGVRHIRREVVARLANALDLELQFAEARRVSAETGSRPEAVDLVMQARTVGGTMWGLPAYERALQLYDRALALDPDNAEALGLRAITLVTLAFAWPGPQVDDLVRRAEADVLRSLSLDSLDAGTYRALSIVRQQQFRLDEAADAADMALALNPNDVRALSWRGDLHRFMGRAELAVEPLERALRLSPHEPHRWTTLTRIGSAAICLGEHARAIPWLEQSWALNQHWMLPLLRAAAFARTGETERAHALRPAMALEGSPYRQWQRVSDHPVFLQQLREQVYGPLVEHGVIRDFSFFDAWAARQRRRLGAGDVKND